jgi:GNAT superfamily N-acetyltransferase
VTSEIEQSVSLSSIDEERFGIRTARATLLSAEFLPSVIEFCRKEGVVLLIARCSSISIEAAQAMEAEGFFLTDTLIYYEKELKSEEPPGLTTLELIRPAEAGDRQKIIEIASEAFRGYMGHYHADPRLDREKCDEAYVSWAMRSCLSKDVADEVLVAEKKGKVVAFATMRMNSPSEGEGVLFAVSKEARRSGIYGCLIASGMMWCRTMGAKKMIVSTQITNMAVQKVWIRHGFSPFKALYTFHKWFC